MPKSEAQKKREQDRRAKEKAHHWLIVHHPWHRNYPRHSLTFSQNDLQDIAWFMGMILNCPWNFVSIVQYQANKDYVIVKVNLRVEITSKLGQYNWNKFLNQEWSGHDDENTKVFEYNFIEFGDQGERQWKEYFPLNRNPPVDFPIDITHNFSDLEWCNRPTYEPVNWTIPIAEPLDVAPETHSRNTSREASISENNPQVELQSPSTIDGKRPTKRESTPNVLTKVEEGHDQRDLQQGRITLDATIYASIHRPLFTANSRVDSPSAPQPQTPTTRFHPYQRPRHHYPSLDGELDRSLTDIKSDVSPHHEHLTSIKTDISGLRISNCSDSPATTSGLENEPDINIDLCYPNDDEHQRELNHWITIKNPFGIRWRGMDLPEFVEIWDWLQLFADGALELYVDLLQRNAVVCLSGSVDLNGILGRHVWKDMLKDPSHLVDTDTFSLILQYLKKDLDGLMKIDVRESKEDYSIFLEPYPPPLPFIGEFEEKQINVKTEGKGPIQALKGETAFEDTMRQERKPKVEESDGDETKRVKLEDVL